MYDIGGPGKMHKTAGEIAARFLVLLNAVKVSYLQEAF